jgi:hypothetical protein
LDTGFIALTSLLPTMDWINVWEILWQHDEWLSEGNPNEHIAVDVGRIWVSPRFARVLMRQVRQAFTKQSLEKMYIATPIGSPQHSPFGQMFDAEDGGLFAASFVTLAGPPLPANPMSRRAAPTVQYGRRVNVFNREHPTLFGGEDEQAEKIMAGELVSDVSLDWLRVTKQKDDWTCNFILAQGSECKQPTDIIGPLEQSFPITFPSVADMYDSLVDRLSILQVEAWMLSKSVPIWIQIVLGDVARSMVAIVRYGMDCECIHSGKRAISEAIVNSLDGWIHGAKPNVVPLLHSIITLFDKAKSVLEEVVHHLSSNCTLEILTNLIHDSLLTLHKAAQALCPCEKPTREASAKQVEMWTRMETGNLMSPIKRLKKACGHVPTRNKKVSFHNQVKCWTIPSETSSPDPACFPMRSSPSVHFQDDSPMHTVLFPSPVPRPAMAELEQALENFNLFQEPKED